MAPEDQQRLLDLLVEATESVVSKLPGFVSANLHKSLDGTRVVNYAQWQGREALETMLENPEALVHIEEAEKIARKKDRAAPVRALFRRRGTALLKSNKNGPRIVSEGRTL